MRTGLTMTMIFCLLPVTVVATTLRLSTDIDLLVLDGKKVSSLLLRGAESIELDNGPHQLVFRVEKPFAGQIMKRGFISRRRWWSASIHGQ